MALRPWDATVMLWNHRRTLTYMLAKGKFQNAYNFAFTTYFIRGEDCGKGILDPLWILFPKLAPFLWDIELEVTTRCYLRCTHCEHTYWPDKNYLNQDLSFENYIAIMRELPRLKWINLTGEGSAFLNKDFMAMVRYAKRRDLYVDFSHDFFYMPDDIARKLIKLGVERIYVSIDAATKETYEKIRIGSDFDTVLSNIRRFVELKKELRSPLPELCFRFAFFKDNQHEIEMLPELIHSLGETKDLGDEPSINIVGLLEFKETRGWVSEISRAVIDRTNDKAKQYGFKIYWSHPTHDEHGKPELRSCTFWTEPYVMITGHVVADCAVLMSNRRPFLKRHSFGNVRLQSLKEIWNSPKYRIFRDMIGQPEAPVPSICLNCRVFATRERARKYGVWDIFNDRVLGGQAK